MLRVFIGRNELEARDRMRRYVAQRGISQERLERSQGRDSIGEPSRCIEKISEYLRLGVTHFTLLIADAEKLEPLRLLSEKVIPEL